MTNKALWNNFNKNYNNKEDLCSVLDVLSSSPNHSYEVDEENRTHETHHYRVIDKRGEKFSGAGHIDKVGHDKERTAEKC